MAKEKVRQHIVPQSYLKRFAKKNSNNNGYNIGVKQGSTSKIFTAAVKDVAFRKNYYDVTNKEDTKYWENYFANNIEPMYGSELTNIISSIILSNKKRDVLSTSQRNILAKMIIFQILRVPGFLERRFQYGDELFDETIEETVQIFKEKNISVDDKLSKYIQNKVNVVKELSIESISDEKILNSLAEFLAEKIWIIYINNTGVPFMTSDSPVVMYNIINKSFSYADNGIGRYDTFIYYPLTGKIILQIIPEDFLSGIMKKKDNSLVPFSKGAINFVHSMNKFQARHSEKQVFVHPDFINLL